MVKIARCELLKPPTLVLQTIMLTLVFQGFVFYLRHISDFVLDYSSVNSVLLYSVPVMLFYIFESIYSWQSGLR